METDIFQEIFDEIVLQAMKHKFTKEEVEVDTREYLDELSKAVEEDRIKHGKKVTKGKRSCEGD